MFSWLAPQQLSYVYIFGPYTFNFLVKFVSPSSSTTRISLANTQTMLEQAAFSSCGPSSPSVNAPWGPRAVLPLRSYMGDHPSDKKAQGRPPTTSWPRDVLTPPGPGKVFCHIAWETLERTSVPLGSWVPPYQPGDKVWVKDGKKEPLQPVWTCPHMVVLAPPTAMQVTGVIPWIHHTRVKKAVASCDEDTWKAVWDPKNPLKVWFQKQQPSPTKDAEPCSSHCGSWLVNTRQKLEDSSALLQPQAGQHTMETWGSGYQNVSGFSLSTLASIPDWYYCYALRYRTSFRHTRGLRLGSEAVVSCVISL